jgi:hypothetical protein
MPTEHRGQRLHRVVLCGDGHAHRHRSRPARIGDRCRDRPDTPCLLFIADRQTISANARKLVSQRPFAQNRIRGPANAHAGRSERRSAARAAHPSRHPPDHRPRARRRLAAPPLALQVDANLLQPLDPALPPRLIARAHHYIHAHLPVLRVRLPSTGTYAPVQAIELPSSSIHRRRQLRTISAQSGFSTTPKMPRLLCHRLARSYPRGRAASPVACLMLAASAATAGSTAASVRLA